MKAIWIENFGGAENLEIREVENLPKPQRTEILVRVKAAALNRADILQRRGLYPPPQGVSPNIPGLEFAGEISKIGDEVSKFKAGENVFGITAGEAQAEFVLTDESIVAKIPSGLSFIEAAAIPEAFITAHDAIFTQANLRTGETLLIHAVGSGVGLAGLQLAKAHNVKTFGTSRTQDKIERSRSFGLDEGIIVEEETNFAAVVQEKTSGKGADVILDLVGANYLRRNLESLALKGRLVLVGLTGGRAAELDMGIVLAKRLKIIGTVLRSRTMDEKAQATQKFIDEVIPLFESRKLKATVDRVFPFGEIRSAHECLESNKSFGKVVLDFGN